MFRDIYNNKKVLITGNTGFKGSWLTTWLIKLRSNVYGIAKDIPTEPSMFNELGLKNKITHYNNDVRDLDTVIRIIKEVNLQTYVFDRKDKLIDNISKLKLEDIVQFYKEYVLDNQNFVEIHNMKT